MKWNGRMERIFHTSILFNVVFIPSVLNEAALDQTHKMIKKKVVTNGLFKYIGWKKEWKLQPDLHSNSLQF